MKKSENNLRVGPLSLRISSFWAFISYSGISIIFTYPMIFRLDAFPSTGAETIPPGSDIFFQLWGLWWFKQAVINFTNPFWTNFIFYPQGVSLLYTITSFVLLAMAI